MAQDMTPKCENIVQVGCLPVSRRKIACAANVHSVYIHFVCTLTADYITYKNIYVYRWSLHGLVHTNGTVPSAHAFTQAFFFLRRVRSNYDVLL